MKATSSDAYTPTTEQVREAASLHGGIAIEPGAFNRWLGEVKAAAWAEGALAGYDDCEFGREKMRNPYREEKP